MCKLSQNKRAAAELVHRYLPTFRERASRWWCDRHQITACTMKSVDPRPDVRPNGAPAMLPSLRMKLSQETAYSYSDRFCRMPCMSLIQTPHFCTQFTVCFIRLLTLHLLRTVIDQSVTEGGGGRCAGSKVLFSRQTTRVHEKTNGCQIGSGDWSVEIRGANASANDVGFSWYAWRRRRTCPYVDEKPALIDVISHNQSHMLFPQTKWWHLPFILKLKAWESVVASFFWSSMPKQRN